MELNVNQTAELSGVSSRTLRHYDSIGLLSPSRNPHNGYREYTSDDLDRLQQILFFRQCGFRLDEIGDMLARPDYSRLSALELQRGYLTGQLERVRTMLDTLDKTITSLKEGITMSDKDKFAGFDFTENPHEDEARKLYGDSAVDRSKRKLEDVGADNAANIMNTLFARLADIRHTDPASEQAQAAIADMFDIFNSSFGTYTRQSFAGLGELYVADQRFTKNIDSFGDGLAVFLSKAMIIFGNE